MTQDMVPISDYGNQMGNGSWTGVMGMVERKAQSLIILSLFTAVGLIDNIFKMYYIRQEVDMCISTSPATADKNKIMDISYPVYFDHTNILMPYPKENPEAFTGQSLAAPLEVDVDCF